MTLINKKLKGKVIKGFQVGSVFGISTANLELMERSPEVSDGVYFVEVRSQNNPQMGIISGILHMGERKTFGSGFSVEVHLLDFNKDIYGDILLVDVLKRRRNIMKFENADALYSQIEKDIVWARKYFLRKKMLDLWESTNDFQRYNMGKIAVEKIKKWDIFKKAERIFLFAPTRNEISFVQILCSTFKDKNFYFPRLEKEKMSFYPSTFEDLKPGKFGILSPRKTQEEIPGENDLIFVPAVAIDQNKNRLGRGGGYFDRFLEKSKGYRISIIPDFGFISKVPTEKHDLPVDEVFVIPSQ